MDTENKSPVVIRKDQTPEPTKPAASAMLRRIETVLHQAIDAGYHFRMDSPPSGHVGKNAIVIEIFKPELSSMPSNLDLSALRE